MKKVGKIQNAEGQKRGAIQCQASHKNREDAACGESCGTKNQDEISGPQEFLDQVSHSQKEKINENSCSLHFKVTPLVGENFDRIFHPHRAFSPG